MQSVLSAAGGMTPPFSPEAGASYRRPSGHPVEPGKAGVFLPRVNSVDCAACTCVCVGVYFRGQLE